MHDDLDTLSDDQINQLFAAEVVGVKVKPAPKKDCRYWIWLDGLQQWSAGPAFCADANAVLPWLEKLTPKPTARMYPVPHKVGLWGWRIDTNCASNPGMAETFARAACLATIYATRAAKAA